MSNTEYRYGCQVICNENDIYPAMKDLVENKGMSVNAAAKFVHKDSSGEVTKGRAEQVYLRRTPSMHIEPDKPLKKQTKENTKLQLSDIRKEIKAGNVSDDDTKKLVDTIADEVSKETVHPRIGSRLNTAIKKYHTKRRLTPKTDEKSKIEMLNKKLGECSTELKLLVDGQIKTASGDQKYLDAIKGHAPMIIWSFHDLGIDIQKVCRLINGRKEISNDGTTQVQPHDIIDIIPKTIISTTINQKEN